MAWSPEFCLSCDELTNGYVFCSEECRLADTKKEQLNRGSSPTSALSSLLSWTSRSGIRTPPSFRTVLPCQTLNKLRSNYDTTSSCSEKSKTSTPYSFEPANSPGVMQAKEILRKYLHDKKSLSAEGASADSTSDMACEASRTSKTIKLSRKHRLEKSRPTSMGFHGVEPGSCGHCKDLELEYNSATGINQRSTPTGSKPIRIPRAHENPQAVQQTPLREQISFSPSKLSLRDSFRVTSTTSLTDKPPDYISRLPAQRSTSLPSLLPPLRLPPSFSPVDWEDLNMDEVGFSSVASEHMECGMLCKVGDGTLCVAGNYWG
ncbi:hypothetical protein PVAG01_02886 [Phlyctema vagabunda]|uniref:Uncharacterized protein n=1 Tax=Phlyctema vagabunda TaxID=108571 RepID=A0ABR4PS60_9HELO